MPRKEFTEQFKAGCWIRVLRDPDAERKTLLKREGLPADDLLGHANQEHPKYTFYSPCTFIKCGLPISLYGGSLGDNFAVIIRRFSRNIDWWYNGEAEIETDKIPVIPWKQFDNGGKKTNQYWDVDLKVIVRRLEADHQALVLKRQGLAVTKLPWNEGQLRYQIDDIVGFAINPKSKKSVSRAYAFRMILGINVKTAGFYFYDQSSGHCERLPSKELLSLHSLHDQQNGPIKIAEIITTFSRGPFSPRFDRDQQHCDRIINALTRCGFPEPQIMECNKMRTYKYILFWTQGKLNQTQLERFDTLLKSNENFRFARIKDSMSGTTIEYFSAETLKIMHDYFLYEEHKTTPGHDLLKLF